MGKLHHVLIRETYLVLACLPVGLASTLTNIMLCYSKPYFSDPTFNIQHSLHIILKVYSLHRLAQRTVGSTSNGAGKTTLAMAAGWVLSGPGKTWIKNVLSRSKIQHSFHLILKPCTLHQPPHHTAGFTCNGAGKTALAMAAGWVLSRSWKTLFKKAFFWSKSHTHFIPFWRTAGSTSNGAGKTALAMAAGWALSGSIGGWSEAVGKMGASVKASIVNHNEGVKKASVTLNGRIDDKEFVITRSTTKKGKSACHTHDLYRKTSRLVSKQRTIDVKSVFLDKELAAIR